MDRTGKYGSCMHEILFKKGRFTQRRQVCMCMGWSLFASGIAEKGIQIPVQAHAQLNILALTACMLMPLKLACTCEISLKTAILSSMGYDECVGGSRKIMPQSGIAWVEAAKWHYE